MNNELSLKRLRKQYSEELARVKQLVLPLTGGSPSFQDMDKLPGSFGYVEPSAPKIGVQQIASWSNPPLLVLSVA